MLAPLVIRRSRLDLEAIADYREDLARPGISFPKVHPPRSIDYPLGDLSALYEKTLKDLAPEDGEGGFIGARYMPVNYLKDISAYRQRALKEFGVDGVHMLIESKC